MTTTSTRAVIGVAAVLATAAPAMAVSFGAADIERINPTRAVAFAPASVPVPSSNAVFGTFDIELTFVGAPTASQQAAFTAAEAFWEARILGYSDPGLANFITNNNPTIEITADFTPIDGPGGVLARAGATDIVATGGFFGVAPSTSNVIVSTAGDMEFDPADIGALEAAGTFEDVVRHEMGHVLGFSDFFWDFVAATDSSGTDDSYTGAIALATYNDEFGLSESFIPVETEGGPGTAFAHWDEDLFANHLALFGNSDNPELMTGFLSPGGTTISDTTIASFEDLGYATIVSNATDVPLPASALLLLSGLSAFGVASRRRQRR